jgi:hypothetical protein
MRDRESTDLEGAAHFAAADAEPEDPPSPAEYEPPEGHRWYVWHCPICGKQYRGPGGHHVAGDDRATSCFHDGEAQPKLKRTEVVPRFEAILGLYTGRHDL